jgi:hypothetical protein
MTEIETVFMAAACETSDAHPSGSLGISIADPFMAILKQKEMSADQIWDAEVSLARQGYIAIPNCNPWDIDPGWSNPLEFTITPLGLSWWLRRKHGKDYPKMVENVRRTKVECELEGICTAEAWARKLDLPLLLLQKILHAERL